MAKVNTIIKTIICFLFLLVIVSPVSAQVDPDLNSRMQRNPIVVDHRSVRLFEEIPDYYLVRARNINLVFSDRSVGQNTSEGLDCLAADSWAGSPASCRRDYTDLINGQWRTFTEEDFNTGTVPHRILFDAAPGKYDRSRWTFEFRTGTWNELTSDFVEPGGLFDLYRGTKEVLSYQFSYLNVGELSDINNPVCGFFALGDRSTCHISQQDTYIGRLTELERNFENVIVYWTSSLAKNIGTATAENFNSNMRNFTRENKKILLDFADIESHTDSGENCSYQGREALCPDYTTELSGGHLGSVSAGKIAVAKAVWVLMAQLAGWEPGLLNSPTPVLPTLTIQPTNSPEFGDANNDRRVDGIDYVIWLSNYNRVTNAGATEGDYNTDGRTDGLDYVLWLNNYGN